MFFCEKCNIATAESLCPYCGNKHLRNVEEDDFIYFTNSDKFDFNILEGALKENRIDVVSVPYYPNGVTFASAGRAPSRKIYIRYKDKEKAKEIYESIFDTGL